MNARRKQVYTALFRFEGGIGTRLLPDQAIAITELDDILSQYGEPVYLVGDGFEITRELLKHPTAETPDRLRRQSAYSVAQVALRAYQSGTRTTDCELTPTYLRLPQAERERNERLKNQEGK
jgi:tRNA A37 threonylcarbamoyladenosine modification protein TsaB